MEETNNYVQTPEPMGTLKIVWIVVASVIPTALIVGGVMYFLLTSNFETQKENLQQQIDLMEGKNEEMELTSSEPVVCEMEDKECMNNLLSNCTPGIIKNYVLQFTIKEKKLGGCLIDFEYTQSINPVNPFVGHKMTCNVPFSVKDVTTLDEYLVRSDFKDCEGDLKDRMDEQLAQMNELVEEVNVTQLNDDWADQVREADRLAEEEGTDLSISGAIKEGRDSARIANLMQIQTVLDLYYTDNNTYPGGTGLILGSPLASCLNRIGFVAMDDCGATPYMNVVHGDPLPTQSYVYTVGDNTYTITATLEGNVPPLSAGTIQVTPDGIVNL